MNRNKKKKRRGGKWVGEANPKIVAEVRQWCNVKAIVATVTRMMVGVGKENGRREEKDENSK